MIWVISVLTISDEELDEYIYGLILKPKYRNAKQLRQMFDDLDHIDGHCFVSSFQMAYVHLVFKDEETKLKVMLAVPDYLEIR